MNLSYLKSPLIQLDDKKFDLFLLFLAPLITSVNGIFIDLYTPSLPAIALAFNTTGQIAKLSISVGMIGFTIGVFTFGILSDRVGRRSMVLTGLALFVLASLIAITANSIEVFMASRLIQGAGVATAAMLARAMLLDRFSGKKLYIAMLYTTIAFGLGPVIAPFIGGYLQHIFSWQANFIAYAVYGGFNFIIVFIFMQETLAIENRRLNGHVFNRLKLVFTASQFNLFASACALCFSQFIIYNLVGVFIVEVKMGFNAVVFGYSALVVGFGYFLGTLFSRLLARQLHMQSILKIGLSIILIASLALFGISIFTNNINLYVFVLIMMLMTWGVGMILPSYIAKTLEPFKQNSAGTAASMHGAVVMLLGFVITSFISALRIDSIMMMAIVALSLWLGQIILLSVAKFKKLI
ncbi:MFS transporter [Thiotrichales bacterium 19S3-7]|nr:MFS transporter [Thiotrichales bacterium 19S3-7]MCF6801939.1 MFS transporter [Thiotrichales bacterium 19S3-11]